MRSSALLVIGLSGALVACASAQDKAACYPVASWAAPVIKCAAASPPPVAIAPPPPEPAKPEPPAEPPPPPPPTAKATAEKIELSETVQFETESAVLVERSKQLLDDVARELADHPEIKKVQIEGHTDSVASPRHNMKLSQDRIASVRAYLLSKGVDAKRLTTKAFGETKPIASNKTEEGRAQNRRVDFRILRK
ncbi:MAG TPA: OmpA family protein [Kofleriaceae bacterium]|jgi:OOP family OmpA-OmpF porin